MPILFIAGHILNKWYQEAKLIADDIVQADETNLQVETKSLLEYQWSEHTTRHKAASVNHSRDTQLLTHHLCALLCSVTPLSFQARVPVDSEASSWRQVDRA